MADLLRILILAPIAYIAALAAAAAVLVVSASADFGPIATSVAATYAVVAMGAYSFVPALIAFVVAEFFRIRSVFFYVLFGGLLGFAFHLLLPMTPPPEILQQRMATFAAAGFTGGFVYWLIAGRLAGIRRSAP